MTSATAVVSFRAEEILEAYVVGSDLMEPRPPAPVDIDKTFEIKTDLNYLFGGAHGHEIIKMPYEKTDFVGDDQQQGSYDRFYTNTGGTLIEQRGRDVRKRIGVLLQNLQSMTLTNGSQTMRGAVEAQLVNLFQEHELQGTDANIKINEAAMNKGLLQFKDGEVDAFVQSHEYRVDSTAFNQPEAPKGLATAIFTASQTAQLLQAASVLRKDIVTDPEGNEHAELKLVDGDKLSCIVKVRATDNDEYDPDEDNEQHWEISFVQTTTAALQTEIQDWIETAADYSEDYVASSSLP